MAGNALQPATLPGLGFVARHRGLIVPIGFVSLLVVILVVRPQGLFPGLRPMQMD